MDWSLQTSSGQVRGGSSAVTLNTPSSDALLNDIRRHLVRERGFSVATLNLDHVVKLRGHKEFRDAYARHTHVVADGNPIVWLARLSGQPMHLAPGADLLHPVIAIAAEMGLPVAFVGGTEASLVEAATRLEAEHPGLRIVARISPSMGFDPTGAEAESVIDQLQEAGAQLCLLALGAPRQEIFAAHAQERLRRTGFLSIGAGLDFVSGHQRRAPRVMRALKAEWLWRMASNPRRLAGRYGRCFAVLPHLVVAAVRSRKVQS
ncbi:WecB/TagA/CpsF family glycosyltransferase [Jannaschia sp. W003]|uniref:WecB/TagA/CpsF family glycosyltransferase n=1 Tax=Jannaschia sp. W003 TaxID=2867012 RepID=UPI0021A5A738|nr:WecB/TagA/CpsF family glycosyltransferase [Jannaschia sp. W003]UWQ23222.1 WecB/TagA/CpsF family glycosyltransferase [Jannaschia sp. W003]